MYRLALLLLCFLLVTPAGATRYFAAGTSDNNQIYVADAGGAFFDVDDTWTGFIFAKIFGQGGERGTFFAKRDGAARQIEVAVGTDEALFLGFNNTSCIDMGAADKLSNSTWYLIVATNDGLDTTGSITMTAYNPSTGALVETDSCDPNGDAADQSAPVRVGNTDPANDNRLNGNVMYFGVVDHVVTAAEVTQIIYSPTRYMASQGSAALLFWPILGTDPEPDWSGNSLTATVDTTDGVGDGPYLGAPYGENFEQFVGGFEAPEPPAATRRVILVGG